MMIRGEMTVRKEKKKSGQGRSLIWLSSLFPTGEFTERKIPSQVPPAKKSDDNCRQMCPKRGELSTSDILCFQPGFYPRDGEQMAGTGVPGRAEGLLIPAFKSTSLNLSTSPLTWRFSFSTDSLLMQTGRTLSLCAHNPAIHQVLYEVMSCKSML